MPSENKYEKQQEAIKNAIKKASKKTDAEILKSEVKRMEYQEDETIKHLTAVAEQVFYEGIKMVRQGEMNFDEFISDLNKTLKAIK